MWDRFLFGDFNYFYFFALIAKQTVALMYAVQRGMSVKICQKCATNVCVLFLCSHWFPPGFLLNKYLVIFIVANYRVLCSGFHPLPGEWQYLNYHHFHALSGKVQYWVAQLNTSIHFPIFVISRKLGNGVFQH